MRIHAVNRSPLASSSHLTGSARNGLSEFLIAFFNNSKRSYTTHSGTSKDLEYIKVFQYAWLRAMLVKKM